MTHIPGIFILWKVDYSGRMLKPRAHVIGIPVEGPSWEELLPEIRATRQPLWIVTLNPEMVVSASRSTEYKAVLQQADVRTVDGFGLWLFLRIRGTSTHRLTGADMSERLMDIAEQEGWKVGCFGGKRGVTPALESYLHRQYPRLSFLVEEAGIVHPDGNMDDLSEEALHRMTLFSPDLLFVSLGGNGTKQEQWIMRHITHLPHLRAIVGIGGTFDYWSGAIPRAPRIMRRLGIEWVWRLLKEPSRIGRIWRATAVFLYIMVKST